MALLHMYDANDAHIVATATNRTVSGSRTLWGITNFNTEFIRGLDS